MKFFTFYNEQIVKSDLDTVWNFFCHPFNLDKLTPNEFNLKNKNYGLRDKIYSGMLIAHQLVIFKSVKINWLSEISHINEKQYFIDKQISGPFAFWQHEHRFELTNDGVVIKDYIVYKLPLSFFNSLLNKIFILKKLEEVFSYRNKIIEKIFNQNQYNE